ncbi:MAG: DUF368 domain-containing protein [Bacteroidales bacterium]
MPKKTFSEYLTITLKGMGMGAADVVPGVSGGTIAFITGIYEELVFSIKSINAEAIKRIFSNGLSDFWRAINGNFLFSLFLGVLISVFSLARLLEYLLINYPIFVWSFFFGLIVASAIYIASKIKKWNIVRLLSLFIGIIIAYLITQISPAQTTEAYWFIFLSGALAVCAMILPGISGAFILLLLGKYQFILGAIGELNILVLVIFVLGAIAGLISFSNILSWFLKKYHDATIALLAGFMIGSLNKVWPWKETTETFVDRHGEVQPLLQKNVLPSTYESISGESSFLVYAISAAAIGFILIFVIEYISRSTKKLTGNEQ